MHIRVSVSLASLEGSGCSAAVTADAKALNPAPTLTRTRRPYSSRLVPCERQQDVARHSMAVKADNTPRDVRVRSEPENKPGRSLPTREPNTWERG